MPADTDCPVCKGTGRVRNPVDHFTTTVEGAAAYEHLHGGMPEYRTCKCWFPETKEAA